MQPLSAKVWWKCVNSIYLNKLNTFVFAECDFHPLQKKKPSKPLWMGIYFRKNRVIGLMVNGERANKIWTILIFNASVREAAKKYKNILFMAGPLRPNLPPPPPPSYAC